MAKQFELGAVYESKTGSKVRVMAVNEDWLYILTVDGRSVQYLFNTSDVKQEKLLSACLEPLKKLDDDLTLQLVNQHPIARFLEDVDSFPGKRKKIRGKTNYRKLKGILRDETLGNLGPFN